MKTVRTETSLTFINSDTQEKQDFSWYPGEEPEFVLQVMYRQGTKEYDMCRSLHYEPVDSIDLKNAEEVEKFFKGEDIYWDIFDTYFHYEPEKYTVMYLTI